jgi:hypothetical protein
MAGTEAREELLKLKSTYVQAHVRNTVTIVGVIEKHQISQHWDMAWRSWRRTHDDDEGAREAVVSDGKSKEEWRCKFFLPYCLFVARSDKKNESQRKCQQKPIVLFFVQIRTDQRRLSSELELSQAAELSWASRRAKLSEPA